MNFLLTFLCVLNELVDLARSPFPKLVSWKNLALINILFLDSQPSTPPPPPLPRMKKKDMTLTELKKYDGSDPDGRVCVAVLGKIYDVTKGKRFYGPGK